MIFKPEINYNSSTVFICQQHWA